MLNNAIIRVFSIEMIAMFKLSFHTIEIHVEAYQVSSLRALKQVFILQ